MSLRESRKDEITLKKPHKTPFIPWFYHLIKNKLIVSSMLIWSIVKLIALKNTHFKTIIYTLQTSRLPRYQDKSSWGYVFSKMWIITRRSACCYLPLILLLFSIKNLSSILKKLELLYITMIWEWIFYFVIWWCAPTSKLFEILLIIIMSTFC